MKENIKKLALLSCLLGSLFIVSNNALAGDGWSGSGGDTDFGGGGDGSGCTGENPDFRIDCSGVSWLKYNYVGGSGGYKFVPNGSNESERDGGQSIGDKCAKSNVGFYHLGINIKENREFSNGYAYYGNVDYNGIDNYWNGVSGTALNDGTGGSYDKKYTYTYRINGSGNWGHRFSLTIANAGDYYKKNYVSRGTYSHLLYKGGNLMYISDPSITSKDNIVKAYVAFLNNMYEDGKGASESEKENCSYSSSSWTCTSMPTNIYAFCAFPIDNPATLSPKAKITISGHPKSPKSTNYNFSSTKSSDTEEDTFVYEVNSPTISVRGDFNFKIDKEIKTTKFEPKLSVGNQTIAANELSFTGAGTEIADGLDDTNKTKTITLTANQKTRICASATTPGSKIDINGVSESERIAEACLYVKYVPITATIDSKTTLTVNGSSTESGTDADGELNLGRVPYGARAITAIWSYNLSSSSRCIESNFNGISCSENNSSITSDFKVNYKRSGLVYNDSNYDDQFVTLRNSKYSSSVGSNTKTYNLLPGEQLTQKQGISHYSGVHTDGVAAKGAKEESSSVTLNATASDVICGLNNQPFGLGDPVNYGRMTVAKNNTLPYYVYGDNLVDGNSAWSDAGDIWLKPTDTVQLIYEACIGEQIQKDKNSGKKWGDTITEGNAVLTVGTSNNTLDSTHYKGIGGAVDVDSIDDKNIVAYEKIGDTISKHISNEYQFVGNEEAAKSDAKAVEHLGQTITNDFGNISNDIHATMKIPYNYYMSLNLVPDDSNGYLTSEDTTFKVEVENEGRINKQVCNGAPVCEAYATKSKKTTAGMLVFTISSEFKASDLDGKDSFSYNGNIFDSANNLLLKNRMVEAVKNHLPYGDNIRVIDSSHVKEEINTEFELYDGEKQSIESNELDLSNLAVGTKVCAVAAVYPSDSHDTGYDTDYNRPEDDPKHWPIDDSRHWEINDLNQSAAFSPTGTKTGLKVSCRTVAKHQNMSVEGNGVVTTQRIYSSTTTHNVTNGEKIFRSWSEYQIISGGSNASSGAVTAYALNNSIIMDKNVSAGLDDSSVESGKYLYPQTLGNYSLATIGGKKSDPNSGDESQVNWRYSETLIKNIVDTYGKGGGDCISGDLPTSNNYLECINGDYILEQPIKHDGKDTLVVRSTGKLTISKDALLDDLSQWGNPKQLIIIARSISIAGDVTSVNAWLIVDGGELNTCNDYKINSPEDKSNQNLLDFCNTQLFINGPVIVNGNLTLPRTFGGGSVLENGEFVKDPNTLVQRAEIFNYDPSVVEWAYRESQKNPHLETTYTETLAPRL